VPAALLYALQNALLWPGGQLLPEALAPAFEPKLEQDGYPGLSQCAVLLPPLLLLDELGPDAEDPELEGVDEVDPVLFEDDE